ncbi:MAG: hypothetical protein ABWY93_31140 [Mycobacterium sp.]
MRTIARRITAGAALLIAPVLIALGTASASHADTATTTASSSISHPAFPHQSNAPQPGTAIHHHHQNRK